MKALVTGAAGFVGANLVRRLLRDGHEVTGLVRPGSQAGWRLKEVESDLRIQAVDLSDRSAVDRVVRSVRPDWVFHLAAYGAYPHQVDVLRMVSTNVAGTVNLVDACLRIGVEVFVNAGSSSEYGFKDHAPSEQETLEPNSAYAVTKAAATLYCRYASHAGSRMVTLRLYSIYGPFEEPTRLFPRLILFGLRGELPPLVSPDVARDFVFTEDAVEALLLAAGIPGLQPGAIYNLGTGVQTTIGELVDVARRLFRISASPAWGSMPHRVWDTNTWCADARRVQEELGWRPHHSLEQGMVRFRDWLQADGALIHFYEQAQDLKARAA